MSINDMKFSCPSCGQRIQCEHGHAGLRIPCPGCGVELEIPRVRPTQSGEEARRAPAARRGAENRESAGESGGAAASRLSAGEQRPASSASPGALLGEGAPATAVRFLCPCCRSELKIEVGGKGQPPTGTLPIAELVRPGAPHQVPPPTSAAEKREVEREPSWRWAEAPASDSGEASKGETSEPPRLGMKPRLSYVLTGKPPAPPARPDGSPRRRGKTKKADPASGGSGGSRAEGSPAA